MRIASIRKLDISNGEGLGVSCFFAGCFLHCYNCFNSELWDFNAGELYTQEHEDKIIELLKPNYIVRLSILGGEPLIERNYEPLCKLIKRVHETYGTSKKIWLYTGQLFENVKQKYPDVVNNVDVLVDGPYIDEKRNYCLKWCGSENQRVIDIEDTLLNDCHVKLHKDKQ